jgi:hypothetical protein
MPIFGRRNTAPSAHARKSASAEYIGRKFRSSAGIEASIENFRAAVTQQEGTKPTFFDVEWSGPAPAPLRVIGVVQGRIPPLGSRAGVSYLAIWPDADMYFVAPDYEQRPTPPLVGMWKTRDASLSSVGSVAREEFAVVS